MARLIAAALIVALGALPSDDVVAQEFAVVNQVFDGQDRVASGTTLYSAGRIYDFLDRPKETIILAPDEGKFDLLDDVRRVRTEVSNELITMFCDELRRKAERSDSETMRFAAAPEFRERLDADSREIVLSSRWMEYHAKPLTPPNSEVLRCYERYVSWQAQLNTFLNPGSPPAGPRMALNAALARRQVLAEQVTLRQTPPLPGRSRLLRAEHQFAWSLDDADRERIETAKRNLAAYSPVSPTQYVRGLAPAGQ